MTVFRHFLCVAFGFVDCTAVLTHSKQTAVLPTFPAVVAQEHLQREGLLNLPLFVSSADSTGREEQDTMGLHDNTGAPDFC